MAKPNTTTRKAEKMVSTSKGARRGPSNKNLGPSAVRRGKMGSGMSPSTLGPLKGPDKGMG